jgi:hypothetical protein
MDFRPLKRKIYFVQVVTWHNSLGYILNGRGFNAFLSNENHIPFVGALSYPSPANIDCEDQETNDKHDDIIPIPKRGLERETRQPFSKLDIQQKLNKTSHQTFIITLPRSKLFGSCRVVSHSLDLLLHAKHTWSVKSFVDFSCESVPSRTRADLRWEIQLKNFSNSFHLSISEGEKKYFAALQIPKIGKTQFSFFECLVFRSKWYIHEHHNASVSYLF